MGSASELSRVVYEVLQGSRDMARGNRGYHAQLWPDTLDESPIPEPFAYNLRTYDVLAEG